MRTQQWLYVESYGGSVHEYELYGLVNDRYELTNFVSTPAGAAAHAALTTSLQVRMGALSACSGATCRN